MKICMASFSNLPLDARIQKEVSSLIKAGHEITLIGYTKADNKTQVRSEKGFREICYPFRQMSSNSMAERIKRGLSMARLGLLIYWKTLRTSADIYHCHEAYPLPACFLAAKLRGKRLVYDAHELYQRNGMFGPLTIESLFIHQAEAVINVNEPRAQVLADRYRLAEQTIVMNCPPRKIPPKSEHLRETLRIDSAAFVVIYHGGFYPKERALDELIRAACLLPQNIHIVILGFDSKGTRTVLQNLVVDLNVAKRVHILDPIPPDQLVEFSTGADVGIIPQVLVSDNQRFANPNKLFEYMASGLAVIATDTPTITSIVGRFDIGEVFARPKAEDISKAILKLYHAPGRLEACKKASRLAAEQVFYWEKEEEKLVSLYSGLSKTSSSQLRPVGSDAR
jgi:glycosyltransferase involved in cell wall biosynthesis